MTTIGSQEAETQFPRLLAQVARGETIAITENGKPVALLVPAPAPVPDSAKPDVKKVVEAMLAYRDKQNRTLGGLTFREMVEEGRRF